MIKRSELATMRANCSGDTRVIRLLDEIERLHDALDDKEMRAAFACADHSEKAASDERQAIAIWVRKLGDRIANGEHGSHPGGLPLSILEENERMREAIRAAANCPEGCGWCFEFTHKPDCAARPYL